MTENNDKILPKDLDSDYSLPGRLEESNSEYFDTEPVKTKPKNKTITIAVIVFVIVSSGFFSYYFINQNDIDSKIIQNTLRLDPERSLVNQYGVGDYGSDHAHAAIVIFIDGAQIDFGLQQFQMSSKYIHFENNNPYLLHKHATGVPLDMLFKSLNMEITPECIIWNNDRLSENKNTFCSEKDNHLIVYVNGELYRSDISQYEIEHNDRIMISFGEDESISKYLAYLATLDIFDVPKKSPQYSENEIFV